MKVNKCFEVSMACVSVKGTPLGEWMWQQMKVNLPVDLPMTLLPQYTGSESRIMELIHTMICPVAKDRVTSEQVCHKIKIISGN